jgi:glyoxylase-like metal-dependent hydrolase (beta-lactamase superfamily II)
MQVSPHVRAVQVPDDNPMHPLYTNIFLVGERRLLAIDSGEAQDRYKWMLRGYLAAHEGAEISSVAITHHHFDHSGNLKWANETLKATVLLPRSAVKVLKGRLPEAEHLRFVEDGEEIEVDSGLRVRALFTPGHTPDSVCYYLESEGVLFTGDTLLGSSTTTVGDLGAYMRSLKMLSELPNLQVIGPGHGPIVRDPRERLLDLIRHREMRDRQILETLSGGKPMSAWDIMLKVYPDLNKRLRRAATGNVMTHLKKMEEEGRLRVRAGKPRPPNVEKQRKEAERAKHRAAVIKEAEKLAIEARKAQLRAQETPPTDQWVTPPKYELVARD